MHIKSKRKESLRSLYAALQKMGKGVEKVSAVLKKGKVNPQGTN